MTELSGLSGLHSGEGWKEEVLVFYHISFTKGSNIAFFLQVYKISTLYILLGLYTFYLDYSCITLLATYNYTTNFVAGGMS